MPGFIPVNDLQRQNGFISADVRSRITEVLERGWYILGPALKELETAFAQYCGVRYCVGTANGTDALELALRACGVSRDDRVITVANAGGYSTAAILAAGAEPVYLDIDRDSMLLDLSKLPQYIDSGIRAIIVTHLYGRMVNMPELLRLVSGRDIPVIEDCAQAHGARLNDKAAGSWGTAGCFSFYPTKNLGAIGDGGAVTTDDPALAEKVVALRQYGWSSKYHSKLPGGRNSRLDEIQAAVLLAKLPYLDKWNERRRAIAQAYAAGLGSAEARARTPLEAADVAHLYVIRSPRRNAVRECLQRMQIGTDIHYPVPDHRQECYRGLPWASGSLPITEQCCAEVLTLPCFPELSDAEVERVIQAVRRAESEANG